MTLALCLGNMQIIMDKMALKDLCSAPAIPGAVPPNETDLSTLLAEEPENTDILFSLGNVQLRADNIRGAITTFLKILSIKSEWAEVRCNLGIAYFILREFDDARSAFKKAVLLQPELTTAHLYLARTETAQGRRQEAISTLEKLLRNDAGHAEACALLAQLWDQEGDEEKAIFFSKQAFSLDSDNEVARNRLAEICFREGKMKFTQGDLDQAFEIWGAGYAKYARAFSAKKEIAQAMHELIEQYNQQKGLSRTLEEFEIRMSSGKLEEEDYYKLFSRFYFSVGLMPELYVSREGIEAEIYRWQQQPGDEVEFPFYHYRVGVLYAYQGRVEEALEELSFSSDHLPESKKHPLKLDKVISFVKQVGDIIAGREQEIESSSSVDDWEEYGFEDPFQQQAWKKTGASAQEAAAWKELGVTPTRCKEWRKHKVSVGMAKEWLDAGFTKPADVKRWLRGGFDPEDAEEWGSYFQEDIDKAVQCRKAGFQNPEEAARWGKVFMFPWEAFRWFEMGFTTRDAALWLANGVKDPFIAKQQQMEDNTDDNESAGSEETSDD